MKVNLQKIIALMAVLAITVSILNIMAYATDTSSDTMTSKEYRVAQSDLIDKYANGDITFTQFQNQSQAVTNSYIAKNTIDGVVSESALTIGNTMTALTNKMANVVEQYGDDARNYVKDWWDSVCNKNNVPTETTQTSTTDLRGFGAGYDEYNDKGINMGHYGDYIVIKRAVNPTTGVVSYSITLYNQHAIYCYQKQWGWAEGYLVDERATAGALALSEADLSKFKWYGDVRYEGFDEGTEPPPNDEFVYGTIHNFDDMNDKQINDLLNDFAEEMERENPDLSSLEGLLKAIYARIGTLDSDNDNDLLNAINANILALVQADKDKTEKDTETNEQLVNTLLEVRDSLKNGTFGTAPEAHGHEISGTVYNVIPLDKNFFNKLIHSDVNLKVEYEGKIYYLEDCGCLKLNGKFYNIDVDYSSSLNIDFDFNNSDFDNFNVKFSGNYNSSNVSFGNLRNLLPKNSRQRSISLYSSEYEKPFFYKVLTNSQASKLDKVSDIIKQFIAVGVPYDSIQENLSIYETIIFNNDYIPQDLTFSVLGQECTLLSYDNIISSDGIWEGSDFTESINIVKALTSILISFWWVLSMYKKLSNLV